MAYSLSGMGSIPGMNLIFVLDCHSSRILASLSKLERYASEGRRNLPLIDPE